MTEFFFIPATRGSRLTHRDFATFASLFAEAEEPTIQCWPARRRTVRLATVALILIGIVGDTVLVARPKLLADVFAMMPSTSGTLRGA